MPVVRFEDLERIDDAPTQHYRLYVLNRNGRVAAPAYEFEADSDEAALIVAQSWSVRRSVELWAGDRKVTS